MIYDLKDVYIFNVGRKNPYLLSRGGKLFTTTL